jgi:hypothetical protein
VKILKTVLILLIVSLHQDSTLSNEAFLEDITNIKRVFGGASISKMLFDYIRKILPGNSILLELGSG